jgi:hypothetical protein
MAGETEGTGTEGMTGADDGLSVEETVNDLAESLHLVEEQAEGKGNEQGEASTQDGAAPPAGTEQESTEGAAPAAAEQGAAPVAPPTADERVPDTWRPEAQAKWATVDPVVRAEIAKREQDVARFVGEATPAINIAKAVTKTFEPYLPMLQRYGIDPIVHISRLLEGHTLLLFGDPQTKAQMARNLIQSAGIDIQALASDPNSTAQANNQQLGYIRALEERLARMETGVTGVTSTIQEAREAELSQGITAFASDTENHPFFWEVANTGEIKALIDSGAARTLSDAYELAVLKNPVTRAKQLALDSKRQAEAAATANAAKSAAARKATSANVKSRGSGRLAPAEETIDETLRTTLSDIHARAPH